MPTLTPARGKDYTSMAQAKKAYLDGDNWILNDPFSLWDGKLCSCRDFRGVEVTLRYSRNRKSTPITLPRR